MNYVILIIVGGVGIVLGAYFASRRSIKSFGLRSAGELDDMREGSREALAERTEKRKVKNGDVVSKK